MVTVPYLSHITYKFDIDFYGSNCRTVREMLEDLDRLIDDVKTNYIRMDVRVFSTMVAERDSKNGNTSIYLQAFNRDDEMFYDKTYRGDDTQLIEPLFNTMINSVVEDMPSVSVNFADHSSVIIQSNEVPGFIEIATASDPKTVLTRLVDFQKYPLSDSVSNSFWNRFTVFLRKKRQDGQIKRPTISAESASQTDAGFQSAGLKKESEELDRKIANLKIRMKEMRKSIDDFNPMAIIEENKKIEETKSENAVANEENIHVTEEDEQHNEVIKQAEIMKSDTMDDLFKEFDDTVRKNFVARNTDDSVSDSKIE